MKIVNDKQNKTVVDIDEIIDEAFKVHNAVFFSEIEGELFIYRPLGRSEYKNILGNVNLSDLDKQDAICLTALLYPVDYDLDNCSAGIPEILYKDIIDKSCLDPESMYYLLEMNRNDAEQLGSEMACVIAEAFPSYTMDEIESWNNFKFMKLYAQAEWILTNIRGVEFGLDVAEYLAEIAGITETIEQAQPVAFKDSQEPIKQEQPQQTQSNNKMSPEQMKAYQEFVRQHPEFADAMQYDAAFTGMESARADTTNPALRPGWYHNH